MTILTVLVSLLFLSRLWRLHEFELDMRRLLQKKTRANNLIHSPVEPKGKNTTLHPIEKGKETKNINNGLLEKFKSYQQWQMEALNENSALETVAISSNKHLDQFTKKEN